jgi:hypothetical protein
MGLGLSLRSLALKDVGNDRIHGSPLIETSSTLLDCRFRVLPSEDLEAFCERSYAAAKAAGFTGTMIVGGLPRGDELEEFATFEEWWESLGPHSDVQPMEESWPAARSRLGYSGD